MADDLDLPFHIKLVGADGQPATAEYAAQLGVFGAAKSLYNAAAAAADGQQAARSMHLASGAWVKVNVAGDVASGVAVLPPVVQDVTPLEQREIEPQPSFYVESAWVDKTTPGNVTDPTAPDIASITTGAVAGTQAQVREFFHKRVGVTNQNVAYRLVADPTLFDTPEDYDAFVAQQTANLNNKLAARYAAHYTTGLLRCFIRGKLGRRLQEEVFVSGFPATKSFTVGAWSVALESDCIFAGPSCFIYVRKATNSFSVWYMTLPDELQPYYAPFYALENSALKRAIATTLLAYASVGNVTATATVPAQPQVISVTFDNTQQLWGGWRHSYWSGKAVWTSTIGSGDANHRLNTVTREATFTISDDAGVIQHPAFSAPFYNTPISVSTQELANAYYAIPNAPRVWYPLTFSTSWIIRDVPPGASAPMDASAPMWAFYDDDDGLVQCTVGMPSPPVTVSEASASPGIGCGYGSARFSSSSTAGNISTVTSSVTGGASLSGGFSPQTTSIEGTVSAGGGSASTFGNSGFGGSWTESGCDGGAVGTGMALVQNLNISLAVIDSTKVTTAEESASLALVVPYCGDGVFSLRQGSSVSTTETTTLIRNFSALAGRTFADNPIVSATGSGTVFYSWSTSGPFGAVLSEETSETDDSSSSEQMVVRTPFGSHEISLAETNNDVWSTPAVLDLDAAFYMVSDFSGATRIATFGDYRINNAPDGFPIGFQ